MAGIAQNDVLTTLAYLMGERTVNSTTSTPRADFIQQTLSECYSAYPFRFARALATITLNSGIATLPTDYDNSHPLNAKFWVGTQEYPMSEIDLTDMEKVNNGDQAYWLQATTDGNYFTLNTKDTAPAQVVVTYQKNPPTLDSAGTITTPYPNKQTIALGARRWVKLSQNPDADISQDQKLFEKMLANDVAGFQINSPRASRRQIQRAAGSRTGDF